MESRNLQADRVGVLYRKRPEAGGDHRATVWPPSVVRADTKPGVIALSIIMPYYCNPGMLRLQYANWLEWPEEYKRRCEIVIVDDGSPDERALDVPRPDGLPKLSIYRVLKDMPWHQHGARNLGAFVAFGDWLLLTDMDHVLKPDAVCALFERLDRGGLDPKTVYMPARVEADTGLPTMKEGHLKPHPNSFVMTHEMYWYIGGYDEDFCGTYGTDSLFRHRAFTRARRGRLDDVALTRYWNDLVSDASTRTLSRKEGRERGAKQKVMARKLARGEMHIVKTLQFQWERVL